MSIFSIGALAVCTVVFIVLIRRTNSEYALLLACAACVVILLFVADDFRELLIRISELAGMHSLVRETLEIMLKAVGIAVTGQLASHMCKDAGETSISYTVELAAKAAILAVSLPLLTDIFEILEETVGM